MRRSDEASSVAVIDCVSRRAREIVHSVHLVPFAMSRSVSMFVVCSVHSPASLKDRCFTGSPHLTAEKSLGRVYGVCRPCREMVECCR